MKVVMATWLKVVVGSMGVFTLVIAMTQAFVAPEDHSPYITVEPRQLALEEGNSGHFQCTGLLNYTNAILWLRPDGSKIPIRRESDIQPNSQNGASQVYSNGKGKLLINAVALNDTQDFVCTTSDQQHAISVSLNVFVMPSYYVESVVIIALNACLLVIFLACMTASKLHERRDRKLTKNILRGDTSYP